MSGTKLLMKRQIMCIRATTIGRLGRHHEENLVGCDGKNMNTFDLAEFGIAYNHISCQMSGD